MEHGFYSRVITIPGPDVAHRIVCIHCPNLLKGLGCAVHDTVRYEELVYTHVYTSVHNVVYTRVHLASACLHICDIMCARTFPV